MDSLERDMEYIKLEENTRTKFLNVNVGKVGNIDDYINLPFILDGIAIGTVVEAVDGNEFYELKILLLKGKIRTELWLKEDGSIPNKPCALKLI